MARTIADLEERDLINSQCIIKLYLERLIIVILNSFEVDFMEKRDTYLWLKSIGGITTKIEIIENEIVNIEDIFDFSEKEIYNLKI